MTQPSIDETLLELAAGHATGSTPLEMIFIFSISKSQLTTTVLGQASHLMLRGAIAQIHDILGAIEDEHSPDIELTGSRK